MVDSARLNGGSPDRATTGRHAIVIGGSISGLFTARVLTDFFDRVTLLERDDLPAGNEHRAGAPHAHHLHLLLKRGMDVIDRLFPAVKADILAQGVHVLDQGEDFRIHYLSGWAPQRSCNLEILTFTRPLLEATVRRHLVADPRITLRQGVSVCGLLTGDAGRSVTGVLFRPRVAAPDSADQKLEADLVVDASGRNSKAAAWLTDIGFPRLAQTVVDASWGYASRLYEVPEGFSASWKSLLIMHRPPVLARAGIIQPVEGNRWMVTLAGVMEDYPPTDEAGFLEYARTLAQPDLYESIRDARPVSKIWGFRRTENRLRLYHEMARLPERFLAVGDSVCAFTPVYGQGLTVAALGALELQSALAEHLAGHTSLDGLTKPFQKRLAKVVSGPWQMATGEDLRWPATRGGKIGWETRLMQWYVYQVLCLIPEHFEIFRRFQQVNHMVAPLTVLFHPKVLGPILRRALSPKPPPVASGNAEGWVSDRVAGAVSRHT